MEQVVPYCKFLEIGDDGERCSKTDETCREWLDEKSPHYLENCPDKELEE